MDLAENFPGQKPKDWKAPEGEKKSAGVGKIIGIGCLGIVGAIFALGVIGAALDDRTPEEREADRIAREAERAAEDEAEQAEELANREAEARATRDAATPVTAMELWSAYSQNEVAAQSAYGNRPLLISGTIDSITLDFMDEPVVGLQTGNQFQSVQLDFDESDAPAISSLRVGQNIEAICNEISEVVGTPMLDDCTIQ